MIDTNSQTRDTKPCKRRLQLQQALAAMVVAHAQSAHLSGMQQREPGASGPFEGMMSQNGSCTLPLPAMCARPQKLPPQRWVLTIAGSARS